jgi:hypothetical protein
MPELKPCPHCGSDNVECLICTINADENQDVHFHIACEACYTSGPIADTGEIAADLWNSLPRALTWTTEPPKVAGWYLRRHNIAGRWSEADVMNFPRLSVKNSIIRSAMIQWAGPIPEPKE